LLPIGRAYLLKILIDLHIARRTLHPIPALLEQKWQLGLTFAKTESLALKTNQILRFANMYTDTNRIQKHWTSEPLCPNPKHHSITRVSKAKHYWEPIGIAIMLILVATFYLKCSWSPARRTSRDSLCSWINVHVAVPARSAPWGSRPESLSYKLYWLQIFTLLKPWYTDLLTVGRLKLEMSSIWTIFNFEHCICILWTTR